MSQTIWKFPIENSGVQIIEMPTGAQIINVGIQNEILCMWAVVNPETETESRHFEIYGTGHPMRAEIRKEFIGTYYLKGGAYVFHIFEIIN